MQFSHPDRVVPEVVGAVHVDRRAPVLRLDVVLLGELEVAFRLELLGQVEVCLRQQILAVGRHQPDHVVVPAILLVHVDREVGLVYHDVKALRLLELARPLQLVRLGDVQHRHLRLGHVLRRQPVRPLPLVDLRVHLDGILRGACPKVEVLRLVVVPHALVVPGDREQVRLCVGHVKRLDNLRRFRPLPAGDRSVDGLDVRTRLREVVDGGVGLLVGH
mmetsp:Transcript_49965/g.112305  ORF Transcript_49965/g.112305 Transcript_49965/m.112305 type:complete len:218 (-) Transcript_49965:103-756(-)